MTDNVEIESLKQIIDELDKEILKLQKRIIFWREDLNYQPEKIKSEAIKEFAERLKSEYEDEKQGRYVNWFLKTVLPCKVGDDVVVLHAQYYDSDCKRMHYVMWHKEFKYSLLDEHKLGETLFFTEKEAIDFVHEHNGTVNKPTFQYLSKRIES